MTATYDCIATTTLGSAQATVTFSSISGNYTDLVLIISGGNSSGEDFGLRFNSNTASNYSRTALGGDQFGAASQRLSNETFMKLNYKSYPDNNFNFNSIIHIMNYANTTTNKTVIARSNLSDKGTDAIVGLWRQTSAITSITILFEFSQQWRIGSTFTLYGIKAE